MYVFVACAIYIRKRFTHVSAHACNRRPNSYKKKARNMQLNLAVGFNSLILFGKSSCLADWICSTQGELFLYLSLYTSISVSVSLSLSLSLHLAAPSYFYSLFLSPIWATHCHSRRLPFATLPPFMRPGNRVKSDTQETYICHSSFAFAVSTNDQTATQLSCCCHE